MTLDIKTQTKELYNAIAQEFDDSRYYIWPKIKQFLDNIPSRSKVLELGSGNGKHLVYRKDINIIGLDISVELVKISKSKGANVILGDMCHIPFNDNEFDYIISVASYHHLDNNSDRYRCINEITRVLKPNGIAYIQVFAMEQDPNSKFQFKDRNNLITWKKRTGEVYNRYYYAYFKNDLKNEVENLSNKKLIQFDSGLEAGNHWSIFSNHHQ